MHSLTDQITAVMSAPPRKYQVRGVRFFYRRNGRALLADDMGLGKTYQTIAYLALQGAQCGRVVVCSPSSVKYNWQRELMEFAGMPSQVLEGRTPAARFETDIQIINYDILGYWLARLKQWGPVTLILDEVHKAKNLGAGRTQKVMELARGCKYIIGLSGTPIENGPSEFFPILHMLDPDGFPSFTEYAFAFCAPKMGFKGKWDFRGASNLKELHERISPYMLRRHKREVLPELPQTQNTHLPVKIDMRDYARARDNFVQWLVDTREAVRVRSAMRAEKIVRLNELRQLAAVGKLPYITEWIGDWQNAGRGKLVTFAIHKRIVRELRAAFPNHVAITGTMPPRERQAAVDAFQTDPTIPIFIANIQAGGEGTNLTAASTVLHTELAWKPGAHSQATDRVNRIGQTAKHVNAYWFIAKGTVEEKIIELQQAKQNVIGQAVDGLSPEVIQDAIIESLLAEKGVRYGYGSKDGGKGSNKEAGGKAGAAEDPGKQGLRRGRTPAQAGRTG